MSAKSKKFSLNPGDVVVFKDINQTIHAGQLMIRPHGRRPWAAVRDTTTGVVHLVPTRDHILEKLLDVSDLSEVDQVIDLTSSIDDEVDVDRVEVEA